MRSTALKIAPSLAVGFILRLISVTHGQVALNETGQPPATWTVTRSDDRDGVCVPGDCSLREAVSAANASPGDDAIAFASGIAMVTLTDEIIIINNAGALTINGPGANNLTIDGGAGTNRIFYIYQANVTVAGVTLTGGNGTGARYSGTGGAICEYRSFLTLDGVYVIGNSATRNGGGVGFLGANYTDSRIVNSSFSGNTAGEGGGGFSSYSGYLTVLNTTISGNTAQYWGGAFDNDSVAMLRNVTIINNTAREGGGIYVWSGHLNFGNTILAGNTAPVNAPEIYFECDISCASFTSAGANLIGDSLGDSTHTGSIAIAYLPTDIRDTDPLLAPLQNNGGGTPTRAPRPTSTVIDRGLNFLAVDPLTGDALAFDQRGAGFARIRDGNGDGTATVDIGAFEFALVSVSGRVTTPGGLGLSNAIVSMTDAFGVSRTATTSTFGFYSFSGVPVGYTYSISVTSRRYRFRPATITPTTNLTDVDLVGLE